MQYYRLFESFSAAEKSRSRLSFTLPVQQPSTEALFFFFVYMKWTRKLRLLALNSQQKWKKLSTDCKTSIKYLTYFRLVSLSPLFHSTKRRIFSQTQYERVPHKLRQQTRFGRTKQNILVRAHSHTHTLSQIRRKVFNGKNFNVQHLVNFSLWIFINSFRKAATVKHNERRTTRKSVNCRKCANIVDACIVFVVVLFMFDVARPFPFFTRLCATRSGKNRNEDRKGST